MIQSLSIRNYALIAQLDITLHRGFSVITGETGAGKSILLGAIGLLLGQRAETRMIKTGESRCVIEAEFDLKGYDVDDFFAQNELDFDGHSCILRRELTATGKSRAFINDTPAQVAQLRELGNLLIDIHSQHQNLLLATEDFQLSVLDTIAHDEPQRKAYTTCFDNYQQACRELREAEESIARMNEDEEYLRFQLQQLDELRLEQGKQQEMEQEAQMLEHAEDIETALWAATQALQGDGQNAMGALAAMHEAQRQLQNIAPMMTTAEELAQRMDSCIIEMKDIAAEVQASAADIRVNPSRLEMINEWLSALYSAMKKHHAADEEALIAIADDHRRQLELIDNKDEQLQQLQQKRQQALDALTAQADQLSQCRQQAARDIEKQMQDMLKPLGIPNVRFNIEINRRKEPATTGIDQVDFLFSANKNSALQRIADVASGGEIARVMLSLKAMMSGAVKLPTIIFDEIDTGVSGAIATRMAQMMKQMADGGRQVISITHLPQIASVADHHYRVFKRDDNNDTTSQIEELDEEQRVNELAHMLSGTELTEAAIQNARELLRSK